MLRKSLLMAAAVALSTTTLFAQPSRTPPQLIGFTSGGTSSPLIQHQTICRPSQRVCPTGMASASGWAGGAAYNAINGSVWHTQGTRMAEVRIRDCRLLCSTPAILSLGTGSVASGLAICESRYQLYQLESIRGRAALHIRHLRSCPLNALTSCRFALPSTRHSAGAVAFDERGEVFYYATSIFPTGTIVVPPQNIILVAKASSPCNIICRISLPNCGNTRLGAITAMAFDSCSGLLYVSDGRKTSIRRRSTSSVCSFTDVGCCSPSPSAQTWHGFDIESSHAAKVGRSCLGQTCRNCPDVELVTIGDPAVGNPAFAFRIQKGQAGTIGYLGLNVGGCRVPGIALACGFWHLNANMFLFAPQVLAGTGCDGTATWALPVPKDFALCHVPICAQGVFVCTSPAGASVGLTNALGFHIGN